MTSINTTSINDIRIFQAGHNSLVWMKSAPFLYARDVFLVRNNVHIGLVVLVTEPAAHPSREFIRLFGRHSDVLATCDIAHVDGQLRIRNGWNDRNRNRQTNQSTSHCDRPSSGPNLAYDCFRSLRDRKRSQRCRCRGKHRSAGEFTLFIYVFHLIVSFWLSAIGFAFSSRSVEHDDLQ
jgi:hypothetical protein